ncbi:sulfate/molybdate ABC transporter ATP-binding protein [Brachybacterium alimentarium]|uniref:sulfate/molybdate ABC transporter ATP-binding protein n=1 Tax=Brachybacterium alimentarium TaxID=47845 RepID=UPI003FB7C042
MSLSLQAVVPERGIEVELEVATGETLALVGPNGAGKSTILSLIAGSLRPADGRIVLDDRVLTATATRTWVPPHARGVTTLAQDAVLFPHLTVLGNIMFGLRSQGRSRAAARSEAMRWLREVGLSELAGRRPAQLSGGQAQRIAIARALASDPRLLLLDEPMAALDIDVAPALRELLRRFLGERTAVVASHDVLDAVTLADRLAVLENGAIVEQGPTLDVLARPRSPFAARFAGLNLLRGIWDGEGAVLPSGERVPATCDGAVPEGCEVHLAVRPSAVSILTSEAEGAVPGPRMRRQILSLEPLGDLVRVRADGIAADVPPQQIAQQQLRPGRTIAMVVTEDGASAYPVRPVR